MKINHYFYKGLLKFKGGLQKWYGANMYNCFFCRSTFSVLYLLQMCDRFQKQCLHDTTHWSGFFQGCNKFPAKTWLSLEKFFGYIKSSQNFGSVDLNEWIFGLLIMSLKVIIINWIHALKISENKHMHILCTTNYCINSVEKRTSIICPFGQFIFAWMDLKNFECDALTVDPSQNFWK